MRTVYRKPSVQFMLASSATVNVAPFVGATNATVTARAAGPAAATAAATRSAAAGPAATRRPAAAGPTD